MHFVDADKGKNSVLRLIARLFVTEIFVDIYQTVSASLFFFSLRDVMIGYLDTPQYNIPLDYPGWMTDLIGQMPGSHDDKLLILTNQSLDVWLFLFAIQYEKTKWKIQIEAICWDFAIYIFTQK